MIVSLFLVFAPEVLTVNALANALVAALSSIVLVAALFFAPSQTARKTPGAFNCRF